MIRLLRIPQNRILHGKSGAAVLCFAFSKKRILIPQLADYLRLSHDTVQLHFHPGRIPRKVHRRCHREVPYVFLRAENQVHIPEYSGHTELILILKIAAVTPFQHKDRQLVHAGFGFTGDVEFAGAVGNLAVAHKFPVNPHVKAGIHTFKIKELFLLRLTAADVKIFDISATGIIVGNIGRIKREGIPDVGILLLIEAQHLPAGRHFYPAELFFVEILPLELRYGLHTGKVTEFPVNAA